VLRYIDALVFFIMGVYLLRSSPGKLIPYLRRRANSPADFASGLKVAMAVRRALGVFGIAAAILLVFQK